jgi:hypothetical protein
MVSAKPLPPAGRRETDFHSGSFVISAASLLVFFGLGFTSRKIRKTWASYLGLVIILAGVAGGAVGCAGGKKPPAGPYSVTVTGTAGSLTHSVTYTITVK